MRLTDALYGAIPTWRMTQEPIFLEVRRDFLAGTIQVDYRSGPEVIEGVVLPPTQGIPLAEMAADGLTQGAGAEPVTAPIRLLDTATLPVVGASW